jgi:Zn finger protein HypA/HybF involved in hydrogenase expression
LAEDSVEESSPAKAGAEASVAGMDASCYCPVCSKKLESRRCKLICPVCGYYMSCADYY